MNLTPFRRAGAVAAALALAAGVLAATTTSAHAAGPRGILVGTVTQPGGALVGGVSIRLVQENSAETIEDDVTSYVWAEDGNILGAAAAGTYRVLVEDYCSVYEDIDSTVTVTANVEQAFNVAFTTAVSPAPTDVCARVNPEISGLPQVGVPLTVSPGQYSQAGVSLTYQWFDNDSQAIVGQTGPTYVPTTGDVGGWPYVVVKATNGTQTRSYEAYTDTAVKRGDHVFASGPAVLGLPIVGQTLTASAGALVPGAAVTYQWFRNGVAIAGQTTPKYKLVKADYSKKLSAVITYKTFGYATVVRSVAAQYAVKNKAKVSTKVATGKKKATLTIKVSPKASKKAQGKITISENGKVLKRVSIKSKSVKVTVSKLKKGKHKLTILYEGRKAAGTVTKTVRIKK